MNPTRVIGMIAVTLALPALLIGGLGAARADTGVLLRYRYTVGQHFTYRSVADVPPVLGVTLHNEGDVTQSLVTERLTIPMLVKYRYPDGSYSLKFGPFSGKAGLDGAPAAIDAGFYQIERVGSRGQIRTFTPYRPAGSQGSRSKTVLLLLAFPEAPVGVGSVWSSSQRVDFQPYGIFTETDSYTLAAFQTVGGRQVALLTTTGQAPAHLRQSTGSGIVVRLDGSLSSSGTARVFVDSGALLDQRTTSALSLTASASNGESLPVDTQETVTTTLLP